MLSVIPNLITGLRFVLVIPISVSIYQGNYFTALVLFMTFPGLALFYGGLVRAKNILSILVQCFAVGCLMTILWLVYGYTLAYGEGNAFIGNLDTS